MIGPDEKPDLLSSLLKDTTKEQARSIISYNRDMRKVEE